MNNEDCKKLPTVRKIASGQVMATAYDSTAIQKITQRTRNLRKSLHKVQKQFDNQAITKFFQRTLKAQLYPRFDGGDDVCAGGSVGSSSSSSSNIDSGTDNNSASNDNDENDSDACATEQLSDLCENNNVVAANGILPPNDAPTIPNHAYFDVSAINDEQINDQICTAATVATAIASPYGIQSTNIFLQKPVLHLNIDETSLMQTKTVVINKHLDACPNFATSFPAFRNASALSNNNHSTTANNNDNNKSSEDESSAESSEAQTMHVDCNTIGANKLKGHKQKCDKQRLRKRRPRKCANKWSDRRQNDAIDSDSNSCDSGVVSDRSFEVSSTDSNKPTTPHRIVVCPSTAIDSPTSEESPKFPTPSLSSNLKNRRLGAGVKQAGNVKRTRGKSVQKG